MFLPLQPRWSPDLGTCPTAPWAALPAAALPAAGTGCAGTGESSWQLLLRAGLQLGVPKSFQEMNLRRNAEQSGEEDSGVLVLCPLALLTTEGPRALPSLPQDPAWGEDGTCWVLQHSSSGLAGAGSAPSPSELPFPACTRNGAALQCCPQGRGLAPHRDICAPFACSGVPGASPGVPGLFPPCCLSSCRAVVINPGCTRLGHWDGQSSMGSGRAAPPPVLFQ